LEGLDESVSLKIVKEADKNYIPISQPKIGYILFCHVPHWEVGGKRLQCSWWHKMATCQKVKGMKY